jgi:hypothetical protein
MGYLRHGDTGIFSLESCQNVSNMPRKRLKSHAFVPFPALIVSQHMTDSRKVSWINRSPILLAKWHVLKVIFAKIGDYTQTAQQARFSTPL